MSKLQKKSARAKRLERHQKRRRTVATLNLTALMDIFTILVFFLLVSASSVQQLPNQKDIKLPDSIAQDLPEEMMTLQISARNLLLDGQFIIDTQDALDMPDKEIPALIDVLNLRAARSLRPAGEEGRDLMILGDREIPYALLEKIIVSANQTPYTRISFAVMRRREGDD